MKEYKTKGTTVFVGYNNFEVSMRKFKKKVVTSGVLQELREREGYEKPTTKRKRKKAAAKSRWKKQLSSDTMPKRLY